MKDLLSRSEVILILIVVAVLGIIAFVSRGSYPAADLSPERIQESSVPPLTERMKAALEKQMEIDALVSYTDYTDEGFEPRELTIKKGQTIRFMNNSSADSLWVASIGGKSGVYPGTENDCGVSAFDTCTPLLPYEFWEFTFEIAGDWSYRDNLHQEHTGIIRVEY